MKRLIATMMVLAVLAGCQTAKQLTANTNASVSPATGFQFNSNKNQENLKAHGKMSPDGALEFDVETTATTPESAIAAAAASFKAAMDTWSKGLEMIAPIVQQALAAGAASQGVPLPRAPVTPTPSK